MKKNSPSSINSNQWNINIIHFRMGDVRKWSNVKGSIFKNILLLMITFQLYTILPSLKSLKILEKIALKSFQSYLLKFGEDTSFQMPLIFVIFFSDIGECF